MSGSLRFDSTSASSEELGYTNNSYSNGHKGNYLGANLGRSGSFRESNENRVFGSGLVSRGHVAEVAGELPPLSQCLALEPITIGDRKINRSGEVKRFLGFSHNSVTEDNPLGSVHARSPPPVAQEDLKRFKESVADTSFKARGRTKKLDESLHKLNKYYDAINSQKHQRNEAPTSEKSGGSAALKNGMHMQKNLPEDRPKNGNMNKRVRTAVADIRPESRNSATPRQHMVLGKDRDMLKESSTGFDIIDEKIRKLPSGGDGWDQKMKRKRSAGTAFMRSSEDDTELKRPVSLKISNECSSQLCDAQGGRSGPFTGTSSVKEGSFSVSGNARGMANNEHEKVSFLRDATPGSGKERTVTKGENLKVNNRLDGHIVSSGPPIKGKGSRAPRTGPIAAGSSISNISRLSGGSEGWDQPPSMNKSEHGNANTIRKRPVLSGSAPMAQWAGQRPQKIQRNRRSNLVSPVSKLDDMQTSSEGFSPDIGGRTNSSTPNFFPQMKGVSNGLKQMKVKHEFVSSPGIGSESEESGAGDNKVEDKQKPDAKMDVSLFHIGQHIGSSPQHMKKDKLHLKGDNDDGVRRQGQSGSGSQTVRSNTSPSNEFIESATKPGRNARTGSDKSGSKSGRPPLKKSSERNKYTRLGKIPNGGSPDCTGDSDDDRDELLAVAEFVRDYSSVMCANSFWKQMERLHGSVRSGDGEVHYLEQELKSSDQLYDNLWQMLKCEGNIVGNGMHDENTEHPILVSKEKENNVSNRATMMSARTSDLVDNFEDNTICKGKIKDFPSLYQRVLSALIVEDESKELDEAYGESEGPLHSNSNTYASSIDHNQDDMDFEYNTVMCQQIHKQSAHNGTYMYEPGAGMHPGVSNGKLGQEECGAIYTASENTNEFINMPAMPVFECPYDQMHLEERLLLELHSIGLYPETVPDLSEDDDILNEEIYVVKKELCKLVDKKRLHLRKACKAIQEEKEHELRYLEQLALERLTEVAYRKLLVTRGSSSSKNGPNKISKQIALSFARRTLDRCRNFEASGKSFFGDSPFKDILVAPSLVNVVDPSHIYRSGSVSNGDWHGSTDVLPDAAFGRNGPMFNRGKKKEVLLDDVGAATSLRASAALGSQLLGGGAKGKRSERDARNNSARNGRPSLGSSKGERQPKSKPKQQKSSQHPTSGFHGGSHNTGGGPTEVASNRKKNTGPTYTNSGTIEPKKTNNGQMDSSNLPLNDLDSIEDLGVNTVLGDHQDLDTWLNFDDDGLPEHDPCDTMDFSCLEIPMDDLSDLNMML